MDIRRTRLALFLIGGFVVSPAISQEVTCENNPMKAEQFCSSRPVNTQHGYYFFGTDDTGTNSSVVFSFNDQSQSHRPDAVMVKLDGSPPYRVEGSSLRPDVDCGRYSCVWRVAVAAKFSTEDYAKMAAAGTMLVSFVEGAYVSDPITVDPKKIAAWEAQWQAMRVPAAPAG